MISAGGYWPAQGEWLLSDAPQGYMIDPSISIDRFAEQLSGAIKAHILPLTRCRICFEPGRWICNDAMHILIQVVDRKDQDLVITDAGGNTVGWERYETDYCPVLNLTRPDLTEKRCHIPGRPLHPARCLGICLFWFGHQGGRHPHDTGPRGLHLQPSPAVHQAHPPGWRSRRTVTGIFFCPNAADHRLPDNSHGLL